MLRAELAEFFLVLNIPPLVTFWEHTSRKWNKNCQINLYFGDSGQEDSLGAVALVLLPSYVPGSNKFIFVSAGNAENAKN